MTVKRRATHGDSFEVPVGHFAHGSDPSSNNPAFNNPVPIRRTMTVGTIRAQEGRGVNSRLNVEDAALNEATCSFSVHANNDFADRVALYLGNHILISGIDYQIGLNAAATAALVAAAVNALPGFSAAEDGTDVDVTWQGPLDDVDFRIVHSGQIDNLTGPNPDNGLMARSAGYVMAGPVV